MQLDEAWSNGMRQYAPQLCWATNGVSACLLDADHDGRHGWETPQTTEVEAL